MADPELRRKGQEVRRQLVGQVNIDLLSRDVYTDRHMEKFAELTQEWLFAQHWTRPGLDLRTKTMIVMVADVSMGETDALTQHARFCRQNGWSEDEIVDAIIHIMPYVGVPRTRKALVTVRQVFAEMEERGELRHG